ncbi:MAG: hypothetical protein JNJ83_07965 [Verrucomicrobiaceae bacterium]|nr:hypothetical protein [Verrucomicrobiaceae bacterium]
MDKAIDYTFHHWPHFQVIGHSGKIKIENKTLGHATCLTLCLTAPSP